MAVHFATIADYLKRTTGLLPASGDSTVCFWVNFGTVSNVSYSLPYAILDDPGVYTDYITIDAQDGGNNFELSGTGAWSITRPAPVPSTWYFCAWTQTGTTQRFYINAGVVGSHTLNRAAFVDGFELLGNDTFAVSDLSVAYCREWTIALTQAQLLDEMQALTAVHTANLYMDCPFNGNVLDISGNGHDWTTVGSATFVAAPTFPSNHTAGTATPISTTLPNTVTQDFGDGIIAWFSYTPTDASPNMLGFWAFSDVADHLETAAYTGSPASLTLWTSGTAIPMQLPLDVGTNWYFRVLMTTNTPPTDDVVLSNLPGPTSGWVSGHVMINDDGAPYRASIFNPLGSDYTIDTFGVIPSGEYGDVLSESGILLFTDVNIGQFSLFNADLSSLANVAPTTVGLISVRSHQPSQMFYVGMAGSGGTHASVRTIDSTGAYGSMTWTLAAAGLGTLAANNDETILYYTSGTGTNVAVKRWDLVNNIALADFIAGVANTKVFDIFVLSDDTILIATNNAVSTTGTVKQYSAAGATLNTYTSTNHGSDFRICTTLDDTDTFIRFYHDNVAAAIIDTVKISDGSTVHSVTHAQYEASVLQTTPIPTATPPARFGNSNSCPIVMLRLTVIPPGEPVTTLIRRERIFRHLSDEQQWIFYQWLQIDAEAGVGLSDGQGSDPQIILQWSDDGGHTWSNEHLLSAGKQGEYGKRAILKQPLGRSRDRVFKVAMSDPVKWALLNAYFGAEKGSS